MRKFIQLIKNKLTVKCYRFKFGSSPTTETRLTFLYSLGNKTPVPSFFCHLKNSRSRFPRKNDTQRSNKQPRASHIQSLPPLERRHFHSLLCLSPRPGGHGDKSLVTLISFSFFCDNKINDLLNSKDFFLNEIV